MSRNVGFIMVKLGHKLGNLTLIDILVELLNIKKGHAIFSYMIFDLMVNSSLLILDQENSVLAVAGIYDNGATTEVFRLVFKIYRKEQN